MPVFSHPEFDDHELVVFHADRDSGLRAIIAVHNTRLGPSLGGCRMFPYATDDDALTDVLRLSRGMTYKAALARLPQGGGKSVIIGDPRAGKTPQLMRAMGRFVDTLGGRYIVAEDSGTSVADMHLMAENTRHVGGIADAEQRASGHDGDPSPSTALGVFYGIQAAVRQRLGRSDLAGIKVAIQGAGSVGYRLAGHLHRAGAQLIVSDPHAPSVARCVEDFGATVVDTHAIVDQHVDVFAPCALGGTVNQDSLPRFKASVIAGAANNQLAQPRFDRLLMERGILYAPDYVINAGGIIGIAYQGPGYQWDAVEAHLRQIATTLSTIFERAAAAQGPTGEVADRMAEAIFR